MAFSMAFIRTSLQLKEFGLKYSELLSQRETVHPASLSYLYGYGKESVKLLKLAQ